MKSKAAFVAVWCVLSCTTMLGQEGGRGGRGQAPTETIAPNIPGVVAGGTKVQMLKRDFEVPVNGPVALPDGSGVLITEILKSRVWKFDNDDKISLFHDSSNGALCLAFDSKGRLITNQTMPAERNKIAVIYPKGQETVLADNFEGKPFGRPNDLVVDKKGGVYFTDPGPNEAQIKIGHPKTEPAVFYVPPGGKTIKIADGIGRPNGLQLSPDEKILYVDDTLGDYILAFDIQPDGTGRNRRNFAKLDEGKEFGPDGMTIDGAGRLYLTGRGGIQVFNSQGQFLGKIPAGGGGDVAFGGPDKKTLYITTGTTVSKVQMLAQGFKGRAK